MLLKESSSYQVLSQCLDALPGQSDPLPQVSLHTREAEKAAVDHRAGRPMVPVPRQGGCLGDRHSLICFSTHHVACSGQLSLERLLQLLGLLQQLLFPEREREEQMDGQTDRQAGRQADLQLTEQ